MAGRRSVVAESRNYLVKTVAEAKAITYTWLEAAELSRAVKLGLPEVDDRYHIWRVPICREDGRTKVGEVVIDAYTTEIVGEKTTRPDLIEARLLRKPERDGKGRQSTPKEYPLSPLRNTIGL